MTMFTRGTQKQVRIAEREKENPISHRADAKRLRLNQLMDDECVS